MAVFTSTRELSQQNKHTPFKKVTGWKKGALAMMGHKDTGEKNAFGKYLGGSIGMTVGANILTSGTDAGEVTKSQRGAEISHQVGVMSFVGSIMGASGGSGGEGGGMMSGITGGGGGAAASGGAGAASGAASGATAVGNSGNTGMLSKAGTMGKGANGGPTKAGAFIKNTNIGQGGGKAGRMDRRDTKNYNKMMGDDSSMFTQSEGGKRLQNEVTKGDKERAINELNSDGQGGQIYTEEDYLKEGNKEFTKEGGFTGEMGDVAEGTKGLSGIPIASLVGEGAGLYAEKMAIADAYKNERRKLAARTTAGSDIRRA
jgi:hypothetical protein